ncbi:MAG: hypothetical protein AAGA16_23985, partial [Cyanobacteria bacterium P01_E01_bin.35]
MGKKNRLVKLVSLGTALAISNITIANADQTPIASSNGYYSTNAKDIKSGKTSALLTNGHVQAPSVYGGVRVTTHSALTGGSIKQNRKPNTVSGLIPQRIAQAELNIPDNVSPGSVSPEII